MQRVTISIDDALAAEFDAVAQAKGYANRSEAIRDLLRDALRARRTESGAGFCVASLSYVYNHHKRGLAALLTDTQHAHHDLVMATTHVHLTHDDCLETVMLKGPVERVRAFADAVRAERGVRHGSLNVIPVEVGDGHDHHAHPSPAPGSGGAEGLAP